MKEYAHTAGETTITLSERVAVVDLVIVANVDSAAHLVTLHDSADIATDPRPVLELQAPPGCTLLFSPPLPVDFLVGLAVEQDNASLNSFVRYEIK
jgi:hypothetical protein